MKNCTYVILLISFTILSSCGKMDTKLDLDDKSSVCLPYISTSISSTDFSAYPIDETTFIVGHRQEGNCLVLDTQFSGGCEEHLLQLLIDESNMSAINASGSLPAFISHNNTDHCEALISLKLYVDISSLEQLQLEVVSLEIENYFQTVQIVF